MSKNAHGSVRRQIEAMLRDGVPVPEVCAATGSSRDYVNQIRRDFVDPPGLDHLERRHMLKRVNERHLQALQASGERF